MEHPDADIQRQAATEPTPKQFGLSDEQIGILKDNGLKPEEITGGDKVQATRVAELLFWFVRLARGAANPKWTREHAFELAYYIATTDDRGAFDIASIERAAYRRGLLANAAERDLAIRLGMISKAEALVPLHVGDAGAIYHKCDTAERVFFYEQDFYVLSNFSSFNLLWKQREFPTSEHAYHWEKFDPVLGIVRSDIRNAPSAHEAFKSAERNKHLRRPDWDDVKVDIMREILRAKVAQHEYVRRKLLATGDRELVEDSWRDAFWGWGPNQDGKNMLGKLWMEIRAELRANGAAG